MKKKNTLLLLLSILISLPGMAQNTGTIHFQIVDSGTGQLVPARLTILKKGEPFNHDVDSYLQLACRDNTIYTASGTGSFEMVPGNYEFWFGRGMEYGVDVQQVNVKAGQQQFIKAQLKRELDTKGLVCGDMHLHTLTNSGHGDASLEERVISCAAEGLEWAVATDHNFLTDYRPYLKAIGLYGKMATTISNEVSTGLGHYNTYPLKENTKVADYTLETGQELFDHLRSNSDNPIVVQINHPRWSGTDFFNINELDPFFGTIDGNKWSWNFDAIEVLNENYQLGWIAAPNNKSSVKRDWFNFLNQNRRICGVGNSDSHTVTSSIAGVPRNYIASSTDLITEIDEQELSDNVKAGKVSVACGLLTSITANGNFGPGSTVQPDHNGVRLQLKVQAASWISCHKAELIRNGVVVKTIDIPESTNAVRLDTEITVSPEKDSWYLLIAYGNKPMFPMVGTRDKPVMPLGFTNPVWVDANRDNKFTSIVDYTRETLAIKEKNVRSFLDWFEKEPEVIPYAFNNLFDQHPDFATILTGAYLGEADLDHQLFLFKALSEIDSKESRALLKKWQQRKHWPLVAITLEKYVQFPETGNLVQQFKKRKKDNLYEKLSYLEKNFSYIHSGAVKRTFDLGFKNKSGIKSAWESIDMQKNGFVYPASRASSGKEGQTIIKTSVFVRRDTMLEYYVTTNQLTNVNVNGNKELTLLPNDKAGVNESIFAIPVNKGLNAIEFELANDKEAELSFMEISNDLLLDPEEKVIAISHMAKDKKVEYLTPYHEKYHGFGIALTDGLRSTTNWHNQLWQGWSGQPMEVVVDLGEKQKVHHIGLSLLADQGSWIFFPKTIQFFSSDNGRDFHQISEITHEAASQMAKAETRVFKDSFLYLNTRYIKVVATPIDVLPEWHSAAGTKGAWIFADEIIVE